MIACAGTVVALLAPAGCARQWEVPTRELTKLQGYRRGQEVALRDKTGDELRFDRDTALEVPEPGHVARSSPPLFFDVIRRADPVVLEGTLVPSDGCSEWVGAEARSAPCAQGADAAFDLRGVPTVRVVRVDRDPTPTPAAVGAPAKSNTGLVVGVTVGAVAVGVGATVGVVYLVKGLSDLHGIGGFGGAGYQGHLGRRR